MTTPAIVTDPRPPDEDALRAVDLVRAEVRLRVRRRHLALLTAHDLFSGDAVDSGTTLLLRSVRAAEVTPATVTDVGCGYGPLGLWAAAMWPDAEVRATDRDALAVAFTRLNAVRNELPITTVPALMLDGEPTGRDLLLANVPGKAGDGPIRTLVAQGLARLAPDGRVGLVVVRPLADLVAATLEEAGAAVVDRHENATYSVVVACGAAADAPVDSFAADVYDRATADLLGTDGPPVRTVHGLPEFDTASHATVMAWGLARTRPARSLLVVNPGQGLLPASAVARDPSAIHLVSRDLLQLRASIRAVGEVGGVVATAHHVVPALAGGLPGTDTAVVMCGRRDRAPEVDAVLAALGTAGTERVVVAGRSRLVRDAVLGRTDTGRWRIADERSREGAAAVALERRASG